MSCDLYMGCAKCKSAIHIAQTGLSGFTFYSGEPRCMAALGRWLREHYLCETHPQLMTEWAVDEDGWTLVEWEIFPPLSPPKAGE